MKGLNLKRIGAVVAGATILASSVAFAGPLYYGDTPLVTETGQPVVKVVVGSGAAASDGVAAANIAAHLAHEAHKSDVYTAKAGEGACAVSEDAACTITDKSVTLEVTVPGATKTGTYTMNTLVGDYIDRTLLDRGTSSQSNYAMSNAETSSLANPSSDGSTSYLTSAPSDTYLYKIDGTMFSPMATYSVSDEKADVTYSEVQNFWIGGGSGSASSYVKYLESEDDLVLNVPVVEYQMKFSGASNDFGIPVCTQATNTTRYDSCTTSYQTETHKVKVMFMGEEWIISDMTPPTTSTTSEQTVTPGGSIKLAKESQQAVLNKGEFITVGDLKFVLNDVALATGASNTHAAIISVYAEGNEVAITDEQVDPGTTADVYVEGYGTYKVHVYETAPGYTFGATWADMAVFSQELKLEDAADLDADVGKNDYWKVSLGWKNKGASATDTNPDHLRNVLVYSDEVDDLLDGEDWTPGLSIPIVQEPANWQLTFDGLDIDNTDRGSLTFTMERESMKQLSINSTAKCNLSAPYIKVSAPKEFIVESAGAPPAGTSIQGYNSELYIALKNITCPGTGVYNQGSYILKSGTSSTSYYVAKNNTITTGYLDAKLDYMGTAGSWANGGVIRTTYNSTFANVTNLGVDFSGESKLLLAIGISEESGEGESANKPDKFVFGVNWSGTNGGSTTFNFDGASSTTYFYKDHVYAIFSGPASGSNKTVEEGYISERGSIFSSIDDTSVKYKIADEVAHAQLTLASAEAAETSANTVTLHMEEGDEETVSGSVDVTIKVTEIDATGTCATGSGGTPLCMATGEGAAYMEDSTGQNVGDSIEAVTMYEGNMDLVVLDSDVTAGTLISVGGPAVNTKTAEAQADGDFALEAEGDMVVTKVGSTIVVAGYSAEDTLTAAETFLSELQ